jgi:hypothetical protein
MFQQLVNIARKMLIGGKPMLPDEFSLDEVDSDKVQQRELDDHNKQPFKLEEYRYKDYQRHGAIKK